MNIGVSLKKKENSSKYGLSVGLKMINLVTVGYINLHVRILWLNVSIAIGYDYDLSNNKFVNLNPKPTRSLAKFLNFFGQCVHSNGNSSLWVIWCSFRAPFVPKLFPHSSQMNGRSPIWMARTCACTLTALLNRLSQYGHGWTSFSLSGRWTNSWRCTFCNVVNRFGHFEQANGSSASGWAFFKWRS